jgi:predicted enzyme related to lactoylglutathione lyase
MGRQPYVLTLTGGSWAVWPRDVGGARKDDNMTIDFPPGTPNWVDLGTTDVPAARAFYTGLFGWTVEDLGPDSGGYAMLRKDGKQVAGIGPATDPTRGTSWSVYFATGSADATTARVESHGGKVIMGPMDVMDQGRMAVFQDPTGAYFSVWQPGLHKGAELVEAPGSLSWVELSTTDIPAAKEFYEKVLGMSTRDVDMGAGMTYTLLRVGDKNVAGAMPTGPDHAPMSSHWSVYFAVESRDSVAEKALELGATEMLRDDMAAGRLAFLTDPQGGTFCIIEPNPDFSV